jgi:autonomous glycyl radical cofactor GrcA
LRAKPAFGVFADSLEDAVEATGALPSHTIRVHGGCCRLAAYQNYAYLPAIDRIGDQV